MNNYSPGVEKDLPLLSTKWLITQIEKYVEVNGFYKAPSEECAKELKEKGLSYCEEELRKLLEGINESTGISVGDIKKFVEENEFKLKSEALNISRARELADGELFKDNKIPPGAYANEEYHKHRTKD